MLMIEPASPLATDYRVVVDGEVVARVVDTEGPAHGTLVWQGERYRLGGPSGSPIAALAIAQAVFRAVSGRRIHTLDGPDGRLLAKARAHGWSGDAYDVQVDGFPSSLRRDAAAERFRWRCIGGGEGTVRAAPDRTRSVIAELPSPMLSLPVQAFLALIALQRWEYLSRGS